MSTTNESRPAGRLSRVLALVAVVVLLAAACSDDKPGAADPALDQLAADAAVLRATDLPLYQEQPQRADSTSSDGPGDDPIATCVQQTTGLDLTALRAGRTARSTRAFSAGDGAGQTQVEGSVEIYRDDRLLSEEVDALLKPEVQACVKSAFQNSFATQQIDLPDLTITASPLEGVGDEGVTLLVKGQFLSPGLTANFASEVQFVRVGRASISATVTTFDKDPDHELGTNAAKAMVNRLHL